MGLFVMVKRILLVLVLVFFSRVARIAFDQECEYGLYECSGKMQIIVGMGTRFYDRFSYISLSAGSI